MLLQSFRKVTPGSFLPVTVATQGRSLLHHSVSSPTINTFLPRAILSGDSEIAVLKTPTGSTFCLHTDLTAAHETISRLREAEQVHGMHIAMAHDMDWMKEGHDQVLMSLLTPDMKGRWLSRVRLGEAP